MYRSVAKYATKEVEIAEGATDRRCDPVRKAKPPNRKAPASAVSNRQPFNYLAAGTEHEPSAQAEPVAAVAAFS
jgi:hypothetical protein